MNLEELINEAHAWKAQKDEKCRQDERARDAANRIARDTAFRREFGHAFGDELAPVLAYELRHNNATFPHIWSQFCHRDRWFALYYSETRNARLWTVQMNNPHMLRSFYQTSDRTTNRNTLLITIDSMLPPLAETPF